MPNAFSINGKPQINNLNLGKVPGNVSSGKDPAAIKIFNSDVSQVNSSSSASNINRTAGMNLAARDISGLSNTPGVNGTQTGPNSWKFTGDYT